MATILVPVVLIFIGIRLLASEFFLELEYRRASFPFDTYGFTTEERLEYANLCIQYLTTEGDISLLSEAHFTDGSPLFNERELSHMEDVKKGLPTGDQPGIWINPGSLWLSAAGTTTKLAERT